MIIIFAFKRGELKEKTQDTNFSLPIQNPNLLLKNGLRIPKLAKNWADPGLPTLVQTLISKRFGTPALQIIMPCLAYKRSVYTVALAYLWLKNLDFNS